MATNQLTDRKIKAAKPTDKEYLLSDGQGLYLRVRPTGSKLWLLRYTNLSGNAAKKSLGPFPAVSLAKARELTLEQQGGLRAGIDPQSITPEIPETIAQLYVVWMRDSVPLKWKPRSIYRLGLRMQKHVLPYIGGDSIKSLNRNRVLAVVLPIVKRGHNPMANIILADIKLMLNYALVNEWVEVNRAASIPKEEVGGADVVLERHLSPNEIETLWQICKRPTGITPQCHASIWLCMSTLCRIEELTTCEENEIDFDNATWTIPAHKNKSQREHVVHLSKFALHFVRMLYLIPRGSPYLFASSRSPGSHVSAKSLNFQIAHRQNDPNEPNKKSRLRPEIQDCMRLTGGRWSHHSLRRTGATLMGELGISEEVIEKCLNHASGSRLVRTYQRQQVLAQRKEAFESLGVELEKITGSGYATSNSNLAIRNS